MKIDIYQNLSKRTMKFDNNSETAVHCSLGIAGEAGEVIDILKKEVYYGKEIDTFKYVEEIGDVMFYIANFCTAKGILMSDVLKHNVEKLQKRYPNGFSTEDALARKDMV